jgi:DUF4097 and DUF4098 domain-containing protein YvlB
VAAPLLLLAITLAGADPDTTLHLPRNGAIEVDTRSRDVVVHVGAGDVVTVRGATAELDGGTLTVSGEGRRNGDGGPIDLTVPSWARIEVTTLNGNVTFSSAPDHVQVETVSGAIHLSGGGGSADLESMAGEVMVADFHGTKLSVDATGSGVSVTNSSGAMDISNVTGGIVLHGIHSPTISASTINDGIDFEGTFAATGNYDFSSQNGDVTFTLPGDVSARLKISTMNGEFRSPQIPATTNGTITATAPTDTTRHGNRNVNRDDNERAFVAVYGSGSARVTVDVFNGDVIVKKKP